MLIHPSLNSTSPLLGLKTSFIIVTGNPSVFFLIVGIKSIIGSTAYTFKALSITFQVKGPILAPKSNTISPSFTG